MRRKTKLKLAAAVIPAALTFLTQYPRAVTKPERTSVHPVVLADIPNITGVNPRLSELMWLGSHDSFSDQLGYRSVMDPTERNSEKIYAHPLVRPITRGISARFSKAQNIGATQQLQAGARLLDIRLTWYQDAYYTRHSLISGQFEPYLREILRFLNNPAHAGEIVMLYVQQAYFDHGTHYAHLLQWLSEIREDGKNLFDFIPYQTKEEGAHTYNKLACLRYCDVTKNGTQAGVVLLLRETELKPDFGYDRFYPLQENIVAPWANSISDRDMRAFYSKQEQEARAYAQSEEKDKLYVMQAQKTLRLKNLRDFGWMLKGFSLLDLARDSNGKLVSGNILERWFTGDFQILLLDNINSQKENCNTIVNQKMRAYNQAVISAKASETAASD